MKESFDQQKVFTNPSQQENCQLETMQICLGNYKMEQKLMEVISNFKPLASKTVERLNLSCICLKLMKRTLE